MYPNWSDHTTGRTLTRWPPSGAPITPVLSSVDNAWLAVGLRVVAASVSEVAARARALADAMHFGVYYRPALNRIAIVEAPGRADGSGCYDTIVSESRMATYLGIVAGEIPARAYFGTCRTLPGAHDQHGREACGTTRTYLGVPVFEGCFEEAGAHVVPSWAGSMFEELMPALFVPEETWGPRSWGVNHRLTVDAQIRHGLATTGYWGSSPCDVQGDGYVVTGLDALAMNRDDHPATGSRSGGVVTPHASFLALRWAPAAALANLARLERDFPIYDRFGFRDSVNVRSGAVSDSYLAVDQGMVMAALGNALGDDMLRRAFATGDVSRALRPLLGLEVFGDGANDGVNDAPGAARSRRLGHRARRHDGARANNRNEAPRERHVAQGSHV